MPGKNRFGAGGFRLIGVSAALGLGFGSGLAPAAAPTEYSRETAMTSPTNSSDLNG
jgi:hypothetical protein